MISRQQLFPYQREATPLGILLLLAAVSGMILLLTACSPPPVQPRTTLNTTPPTVAPAPIGPEMGLFPTVAPEAQLLARVVTYPVGAGHSDAPVYDESLGLPPVGGLHSPEWQNCGIYTGPIAAKHAVHSLEHGAVWLTYQPSLSLAELEPLQDLVIDESYVLMSPYAGLRSPVVLSAWGVQLEVQTAADPLIPIFVTYYQQGPQTPEPGAPCQGGVGNPINLLPLP